MCAHVNFEVDESIPCLVASKQLHRLGLVAWTCLGIRCVLMFHKDDIFCLVLECHRYMAKWWQLNLLKHKINLL